jgi:hypothetical protein
MTITVRNNDKLEINELIIGEPAESGQGRAEGELGNQRGEEEGDDEQEVEGSSMLIIEPDAGNKREYVCIKKVFFFE